MKLTAVATACAIECERQQVGLRELGYLLEAYMWLVDGSDRSTWTISIDTFDILGSFVEPKINRHGFRKVPVTFQNGGSSCLASEIPRQLDKLVENINVFLTDTPNSIVEAGAMAMALTREFLWIHPFADGNGRVGFLIYNYLLGTLNNPEPLPDFNW